MPKISKVKAAGSRPGNAPPPKETLSQYICTRCGKIYQRQKGNFSPSYSPLYRGNGGYLTVCHHCLDDLLHHYKDVLEDEGEAIRRLCMKFDIYWNPKIYGMLRQGPTNSRIRSYISRCNLNVYVGKTYDDTLDEEAAVSEAEDELEAEKNAIAIASTVRINEDGEVDHGIASEEYPMPSPEVVEFWGAGLTPDYYYMLQKRFDKWTGDKAHPLDSGTEALYKQVCICEEQINRGIIAGASVDKPQNTMNSLLGSLNEKPAQKKQEEALDAEFEKMPFGVGIKMCEYNRPILDKDPMFQDVDGIIRYVTVWFLGHLCSMLNIRNSYCKLYEDEIARLRVERPELEDEDDEAVFNDIFGDDAS